MSTEERIFLFDEFKQWCKARFDSGAASDYPSRLKSLNRDFISGLDTGTKSTPFELLEKYMTSSAKGPKIDLIIALLEALQSCVTKKLTELKALPDSESTVSKLSSKRTALRSYAEFLIEYVKSHPHRQQKITPTEQAVLAKLTGDSIKWAKDDLISNFTQRISTQDRPSGNKTLLPLGLIAKLSGKALRDWAKTEASKVVIHLANRTVTVSEVEELKIDTTSGVVTVDIEKGEKNAIVYNPPIGGVKTELLISRLNEAHLDHRPEIHEILVKMEGQLPGLEFLTEAIKKAQEELGYSGINSQNADEIYAKVLSDPQFKVSDKELSQIMNDIKAVTSHHVLQLSSATWNQSTIKQAKKNTYKMIYTHEFRPEPLPDDIRIIAEALETPIEKQGLWIIDTLAETEGKYADFYPQIGLLVLDNNFNLAPISTLTVSKSDGTSVADDIVSESSQGLDDLIPDANVTDFISDYVSKEGAEEYIKSVLNKDWTIAQPIFNKKLPMHLFKTLTSAKYHLRRGSLYAEAMNERGYAAYPSKLRFDEVIKLFSEYLGFYSEQDQFAKEENIAIDTPQYVIYFHLDRIGGLTHELRQINKYQYNRDKILPFLDSQNKMAPIPYEKWASILECKPVLMFGWDRVDLPDGNWYVLISFLGEFNVKGIDPKGNFLLDLADLRFDFPV